MEYVCLERALARSCACSVALGGGLEAEAPLSFRLHTWTNNSIQVGQEMPEPTAISWDPTGILVALAYPAQVSLGGVGGKGVCS
eukprot:1137068-Pelagomonas_calceolata.AAC.1